MTKIARRVKARNQKNTGTRIVDQENIAAAVAALRAGQVVAYPTDTSYGLAADATNSLAVARMYRVKERTFRKPVHVVVASVAQAKRLVAWNRIAGRLAKKFWPGPLTLVLPLKSRSPLLKKMSAGTGSLGLRMPKHGFVAALSRIFKRPFTATSANPSQHRSGGYDSYSAADVVVQFSEQRHRPDLVVDGGRLPRRRPSTVVKIANSGAWEILRAGPVSKSEIKKAIHQR